MVSYSVTDTEYIITSYLILYFDIDKYRFRSNLDNLPILKLAIF